ncbi:DHHW family protein [Romboutsia sedimentorum]|uniref:DHHW family protein n=1 Tax=Romboutsia sedimentorum TaxID=1368474 RepID=UPI0024DE3D1F|nr:DHHW family protein [Romboutsia sedimentorum]MDK2584763.1 DHHW family protein [Romboutsia sedimentorum]
MKNYKNKMYKKKIIKNKYFKILALLFLAFIFGVVILNTITKDKQFSESENRMLAKKPKFTIEKLLEGRFSTKYEKYKIDQFIGRDFFINAKSHIDEMLGKNENNGVYICDDGYLMEDFKRPDEKYLNENIKAINDFSKKHKEINQYMLIAPNAISILNDKLPKFAPIINQKKYLDDLNKSLNDKINFVDGYKALNNHKSEYIYYKTDHHWTTLGAYYGFLESAKSMKLDVKGNNYNIEPVTNDFHGTLYSKSGFASKDSDIVNVYLPKNKEDEVVVNYVEEKKKSPSIYDSKKLQGKDKYEVFLGGNHPLLKINTTLKSEKKLLLIKDSYANSFVQFLTPYFSEIVMVDPRYFYEDIEKLIDKEKITDMLYLYNANTFFSDTSLSAVLNNI